MSETNYNGFCPVSITLEDMMAERERRAQNSERLIKQLVGTVVCMTMNFIGEYKLLPLSYAAFSCFYKLVFQSLACTYSEFYHKPTGDTAFFITKLAPNEAKLVCQKIENYGEIGRLFDIDVFDNNGEKLSRSERRSCLVCHRPAAECSRSRAHGVFDVRRKSQDILNSYFADEISHIAEDALVCEVDTTPKPGLVDRLNSGANNDMDYNMFIKSAESISHYFGELFKAGSQLTALNGETELARIKDLGLEAEKAMLCATGGINTHKGAIYSMGLLSAGAGYALAGGGSLKDAVFAAAEIAKGLAKNIADTKSHGAAVCEKYGVAGARGEAIGGFKTVLYAFERIKHYADDRSLDLNQTYPLAINDVMCIMNDTNVLHRGGANGLDFMHKRAREIAELRENMRIDEMILFDKELTERNISPGGCADMLACAIFLLRVEQFFDYVQPKE